MQHWDTTVHIFLARITTLLLRHPRDRTDTKPNVQAPAHSTTPQPQVEVYSREEMFRMMHNTLVPAAVTRPSMVLSPASAAPCPFGNKFSGDGTYYGNVSPGKGNCAIECLVLSTYDGVIPRAVSFYGMYDDSKTFGACIEGTGSGNGAAKNPIRRTFKGFVSDSCAE